MQNLVIYQNAKLIKSQSRALIWFGLIALGLFGALTAYNYFFQEEGAIELSSIVENIIILIFVPWFSLYLINEIIRMKRLCKHQGPLITLNRQGVTDHFYSEKELEWGAIKFVGCRTSFQQKSVDYFIILPKKADWKYRLQRLYSTPMKYQLERLTVAEADMSETHMPNNTITPRSVNKTYINKYLGKHYPKSSRNKPTPIWLRYIPYAVLILALVLWVLDKT